MLRMVIADDHSLLRSGLARLFKGEFQIVAETSDGESTVSAVDRLRPDVLLLDLYMPRCEPTELVSQFVREHPGMRIVMLTGTADHSGLPGLLGLGVSAIVLKGSGVARLREAIARALEQRVYVDPELRLAAPALTPCLTPRESEVMELLVHGNSYREIGSQLHLGERTVETYRRRIADKLGVRSRAELVAYALRHKLVQPVADADSG
jgi:DNA-binding NarL/FixJ family response regulator